MPHKILLIEDEAAMAENISEILELAHYNVTIAPNGKIGVALAQENHPDLILCDVMMPELDGYGVINILNSDPDTATIPFIFLTAKADREDVRAGMNFGADDYITKPFSSAELLQVIETRLRKAELLKSGSGGDSMDSSYFFNKSKEIREFHKLYENRPVRSYKRKDLLFMEGQIPNDLYYILQGQVKTYKVNYDGKELITGIYGAGEYLGYVPLLEDKPYGEQAEVLEDVRIAVIPKSDFLALIYSSKDVARKFIKTLSNNLDEMEERLLNLAYQSVRQRVAGTLLKMSEKFSKPNSDEPITIARRDISNIVGTATESLNRILTDFKNEGLIETSGAGIKIINKAKLERILY